MLLLRHPSLDPVVEVPGFHFGIVTLASGVAMLVALVVLAAADKLQDPRAFFLGLAYLAIAGFFFIHGLLTPGVVFKISSNGIAWAPLVSLLLGSISLALSTSRLRPDAIPWAFRHRKALMVILFLAWVGYLAVSIASPRLLDGHQTSFLAAQGHMPGADADGTPDDMYAAPSSIHAGAAPPGPWIAAVIVTMTAALLLFSALRYARIYRLSRLPLHAMVLAGIVLLLESLVSLFFAPVWRISWWQYHALVLLGVAVVLYGMVADYLQGSSLSKTVSALLLRGSLDALEQSYSEVLTGLTAAVEARDPYTKGHSEKVARLAVRIGEHLGLSPEHLRVLHQAGLMHDVGKIGIPDGILNKPDRLTPAELTVVREHPLRSEEMISRIPSLRSTLPAIRWHHERLDGSGYPDGLKGEAIPLDARIMAVADVYDAMSSARSYRPAWPEYTVMLHLEREAGHLYDPRCVEALRAVVWGMPEAAPGGVPEPVATRD